MYVRDKALTKFTKGNSIAEAIGDVKTKIKVDMGTKFTHFRTHI